MAKAERAVRAEKADVPSAMPVAAVAPSAAVPAAPATPPAGGLSPAGPAAAARLNEAGIWHFKQVAAWKKAEVEWMARQFAKINVQLEIRATDYNRFQEKAEKGSLQVFWWGWFADYPDAENFLFLLYGPNSKALTGGNGENASNYSNPEFDRLFDELKYLDDGERKQQVIDRMAAITQHDAPWTFGYNPYAGSVNHQWVGNVKAGPLVNDRLMYMKVDPALRSLVGWLASRLAS